MSSAAKSQAIDDLAQDWTLLRNASIWKSGTTYKFAPFALMSGNPRVVLEELNLVWSYGGG